MTTANSRERIAARMASADEDIRLEGIRSFSLEEAENLLDLVFQGFGDPSWRVRKEATDLFLRLPVSREIRCTAPRNGRWKDGPSRLPTKSIPSASTS